ncbi:MAG: hypothetical protein IJA27_10110 [Lachnospiraceae bacterium]|nr:hypothetical protein [Lachnospiraceae bacterium]
MKKILYKLIILFCVFALVVGIYIFFNREKKEENNIIMGEPTLPTVTFLASAGEESQNALEINELFGYTTQMETKYMRNSITPIGTGRTIVVRVKNYENVIMGAEFELRTLDCERLIEKTEVNPENIVVDGEYTNITFTLDNMIDADTEYYLTVKLVTDRHESVYFYTRIEMLTDNYCQAEIEFAKMFSNATFDKSQSENIIGYLEPDSSEDNTNFGKVTIHSSYNQITWGELAPEKVTEPVITIKEVLNDVACYEMIYKVRALNDYDVYQYYTVKEYFRLKWTEQEIYLLDYERTMNQIFDASNQNISSVRINLGISSELDCEYMASDSTTYIAFAKQNGLWLMDIKKNEVISLFAFEETQANDIRQSNVNNQIQIVSVDDAGNTDFIVYGYMSRGEHEGMVGVSLYSYDSGDNLVREKIFIPFTRQYGILKETMGRLCYVNEENVMYVMLSDSVYSVDLTGSEYVQIISNLKDGNFAVNQSGNIIAWETDGTDSGSDAIKMLDLETGTEYEVKAAEGTKLKVLGFVDDDMVYGTANTSDIVMDGSGDITVAMNKLEIINMSGEKLKEYVKEGYYFTDADISQNMINLSRVTRDADGVHFVKADDFQIFGNEEEEINVVTNSTISTDKKKKEVVIQFVKKVTTSSDLKNIYPKEIQFSETNALSIRELITGGDKYYVYGKGTVCKVTDKVADAINLAYDLAGVVISEESNYAWARISKPTRYEITGISIPALATEDVNSKLASCLQAILLHNGINADVASLIAQGRTAIDILKENITTKKTMDLSGCTLEQMLYYVCQGDPVLAMTDNSNYVLIVGYDFYNVVLLNPVTGETYKQGQEEAGVMFENAGNKFVVVH